MDSLTSPGEPDRARSTHNTLWLLNPSARSHHPPGEEADVQYFMVYIGQYSRRRRAQAAANVEAEIAVLEPRFEARKKADTLGTEIAALDADCTARGILVRKKGENSTIVDGFVLESSWGDIIKGAPGLNKPQIFSFHVSDTK